eukprot:1179686-Prorocentrum_minimum.AAC.3
MVVVGPRDPSPAHGGGRPAGSVGGGAGSVGRRAPEAAFTATFATLSLESWTDAQHIEFRERFQRDLAGNFAHLGVTAADVVIKRLYAGSVVVDAAVTVPDVKVASTVRRAFFHARGVVRVYESCGVVTATGARGFAV